jgi:hypothetical protein
MLRPKISTIQRWHRIDMSMPLHECRCVIIVAGMANRSNTGTLAATAVSARTRPSNGSRAYNHHRDRWSATNDLEVRAVAKQKKHLSKRDAQWAEAKRLCRLSVEDVRKAKGLGLNPRKLIKNRPNPHEQWKMPVHLWVRELYERQQQKKAKRQAAAAEVAERVEPALPARAVFGSEAEDEIPF